jgi:hypothetical protein
MIENCVAVKGEARIEKSVELLLGNGLENTPIACSMDRAKPDKANIRA